MPAGAPDCLRMELLAAPSGVTIDAASSSDAAYAESSEPAPTPAPRRKKTPVAPSGNCPICYEKLSRDATVFECSHAMCASCSDSYAKSEVERSMSRRSGVSVACPLCRAPSKVVLPEEMHTSLPL